MTAPPDANSGPAELALVLGERQVSLGNVAILAANKLFGKPLVSYPLDVQFGDVARLIGYDLPQQAFDAGGSVPLTLYWESLVSGTAVNYTVFAHILAEDGHLVGQHDAVPGNGRSPTSGWLAGEYIIDPHEMTFREAGYSGLARIEVGLYDPVSDTRLTIETGDDYFYLPIELEIKTRE